MARWPSLNPFQLSHKVITHQILKTFTNPARFVQFPSEERAKRCFYNSNFFFLFLVHLCTTFGRLYQFFGFRELSLRGLGHVVVITADVRMAILLLLLLLLCLLLRLL